MSREEIEHIVDQEVLSYGFAEDFKTFLVRERLFEIQENMAIRSDWKALARAFGVTVISCGIFWAVVIWRFLS